MEVVGIMADSRKKSLTKTISWQIVHMIFVAGSIYILTGEWEIAGIAAVLELVWESVAFYLHERAWAKWGKKVK
jgi:uncharacterized membrane protein